MDIIKDTLQQKIDEAKSKMSEDTIKAINTVPWQEVVYGMRQKKGYNFDQLATLELETELLFYGLIKSADYPKELETRMHLSEDQAQELVKEMNDLVFSRIRQELIKITESKSKTAPVVEKVAIVKPLEQPQPKATPPQPQPAPTPAPAPTPTPTPVPTVAKAPTMIHPILEQKLAGSFQMPKTQTEYSLNNLSQPKAPQPSSPAASAAPKVDPYREIPE